MTQPSRTGTQAVRGQHPLITSQFEDGDSSRNPVEEKHPETEMLADCRTTGSPRWQPRHPIPHRRSRRSQS